MPLARSLTRDRRSSICSVIFGDLETRSSIVRSLGGSIAPTLSRRRSCTYSSIIIGELVRDMRATVSNCTAVERAIRGDKLLQQQGIDPCASSQNLLSSQSVPYWYHQVQQTEEGFKSAPQIICFITKFK